MNAAVCKQVLNFNPPALKVWLSGALHGSGLTLDEYAILHLKARGYTIIQIGRACDMCRCSVNQRLKSSYAKLGVRGYKNAVKALKEGGYLLESVPGAMMDREMGLS